MALEVGNFSPDGKYFAQLSTGGKLKLWNTLSNSLEQEFTPDFHLTTPCTCLHFYDPPQNCNKESPTPKKKKRKGERGLSSIVLGTTSGVLLVYSVAKGGVEYTVDSKTNSPLNCLSIADGGSVLYSGSDCNILEFNLKIRQFNCQWKGGNEPISSILAIPKNAHILTASKNIKLWNVEQRNVLRTFTGHSSEVIFMLYIDLPEADTYILSGSKGDRLLSCWNLSSSSKQKNAVCNYLMQDLVQHLTVHISDQCVTSVAATSRNGAVQVFQHKLNGKCDKPIKPKTSIQVVSDTGQSQVKPIKVFGARFLDSDTVCLGHGSEAVLTFENVTLTSKRTEVLIRQDPHSLKQSKEQAATKLKSPLVSDQVHYVSTDSNSIPTKRKSNLQEEIPMEQRLENLTLSKSEGKVPRVDNVAQLLLQGLHSKDKNLLRTALCRNDETVIRNTVKRLPVTVFDSLIAELSGLIHGKTVLSRFGVLWLKNLAQVHAGVLISNPNLSDMLSGALGSMQNRIGCQAGFNRLQGKLALLVPQIKGGDVADSGADDAALLVFNDKELSDSESEQEMPLEINSSDSEPENWDDSEGEAMDQDEGGTGDSSDSEDSVVMIDQDSE